MKTFKAYLKESDKKFKPPSSVQKIAKDIIAKKEEFGDDVKGGTRVGWTRARQLANGDKLSYDIIKRMYSFFSRHSGNENVNPDFKDEPYRDAGYTSWAIWGGDPAFKWVKGIIEDESKA